MMLKHDKHGGQICFQQYVGNGNYGELQFTLCVSVSPTGTLLGMPVFNFKDENRTTVTFELKDLLPKAYEFAFSPENACRNTDEGDAEQHSGPSEVPAGKTVSNGVYALQE